MISSISLSDLQARGVVLRPHEAVAIVQSLICRAEVSAAVARPPYGPPTPETVHVCSDGSAFCLASAATPAVSEIAILLQALLPMGQVRTAGGLRYAIGRALLEVEAPPFDSIEDFSRALARYEQGDRAEVVRNLVDRAEPSASVVPFDPHVRVERRRAGPGADELRRLLREADREYYETVIAQPRETPPPSPAPDSWRRPATIAAGLAAAIALIAAGELARQRDTAHTPAPAAARAFAPPAVSGRPTPKPTAAGASRVASPAIRREAPSADDRGRMTPASSERRRSEPALDHPAADRQTHDVVEAGTLVAALDASRRPIFSPSFASNGTAMFFHTGRTTDRRSALMEVDVTSPDLRVMSIVDDGARNYHVQPSPDGKYIAFDSDRDGDRGVYIANRDGTNVRRVSGPGYAAVPTWSPDSSRLTFVRAEPRNPKVWNLWLLTLASRTTERLTHYSFGQTWSASWFPDGRRLCYTHEDKLVLLDLPAKHLRQFSSPIPDRLVRTPAVSPDGSKVIFQVYGNGVWLLDVKDGSMRTVLTDPTAEEFAWAPDGRRVAFHSRRDGQWGIYLLAPGL